MSQWNKKHDWKKDGKGEQAERKNKDQSRVDSQGEGRREWTVEKRGEAKR